MDIRVLSYFLIVAQEENITKAANLLHITQPTLSRQLMNLEAELGVKLFKRGNHSVFLSEEGLLFKRRAQEIVALAQKAQTEVLQTEKDLTGIVSIGCGEMRSVQELGNLISSFQVIYPKVKFELYSCDNEDIKERMDQGILDLGLLLEPVNVTKYDFMRMQTKERWGVLIHQEALLAQQKSIRPGDLVGTPVITVHLNTTVHRELASWSGDFAKDMEASVNYNLLYNAVIVARQRQGAVICVDLDCQYDKIKFLPLEPKLELSSILAWKDQSSYSKAATAFIEYVKNNMQNKHII